LALQLAASAAADRPDLDLEAAAVPWVIRELTRLYLADVPDPLTRRAVEAAAVVRRATIPLLRAMLPDAAPQDAFDRLRALPFVESARDGLHVHDAVQQAVAEGLRAADPIAYQALRRAAWRQLRAEVRLAGTSDMWRYTADLLYLVENYWVREAFFPSGAQHVAVEAARPEDGPAIQAIIRRHDGPQAAALLDLWWEGAPQVFSTMRGPDGTVVGFYCLFDPQSVDTALLRADPVAGRWLNHLRSDPVPKHQRVLFCRRLLSLDAGELPSAAQGAGWLDLKRTYMELRPHLRRCYVTLREPAPHGPVMQKLGFRLLPEADVTLDGANYHSTVVDFGPPSIDGWLAGLIGAELGGAEDGLLDVDARELVIDGRRAALTRLEFEVMRYLAERGGRR
ncbi:MAG: winged helix-turn-helix domain-containing protein, partial [Chloroflexota bacterium]